jgi:3-hydroxymyristoyl/3-hydroxydecanoyl-(acyl carrier protein) dehydratase
MSVERRFAIPEDSPFFTGHFPGHPILPGIAHPLLVAQCLGGRTITEIPSLKLRNPVGPGDVLDLTATGPADDGTVKFELRRGGDPISSGTLRLAPPDWLGDSEPIPAADPPESSGLFPPVASLVPHAPPALLVHSVLEASVEGLTGLAAIPAASPFVAAGRAPAFLALEAAAQGAAVLEALGRSEASGPRIGYLVGLRNARFSVPWLPAERPFRIAVRLSGSAPPLSIYEVTVEGGGGVELARGTLSTFITLSEP